MKSLFMAFCLSISMFAFGQNTQDPEVKSHEVGLNLTSLINSVIDIGQDPAISDFNFYYRYNGSSMSYRFSALTRIANSTNDIGLGEKVENKNSSFGFRVSLEGNKSISSKFTLIYGWDLLTTIGTNKSINPGSLITNTNNSTFLATGPALRIQYHIGENISLMAESTFYMGYIKNKSKLEQTGFPEISTESSTFSTSSRVPTAIFLAMNF